MITFCFAHQCSVLHSFWATKEVSSNCLKLKNLVKRVPFCKPIATEFECKITANMSFLVLYASS